MPAPLYSDKDLLDYLDRATTTGDLPDVLSLVLDTAGELGNARSAIAKLAEDNGHESEPIGTVSRPASDFAFLAADHGRLQWAFMLVDDGKAKDLAEAVATMRSLDGARDEGERT